MKRGKTIRMGTGNQDLVLVLFRIGALWSASAVCGTVALFAAREARSSPTRRLFPWLLGIGAGWYALLPLQIFLYPMYDSLFRTQPLVMPTGLQRPFLLLLLAGLAHCYIVEVPGSFSVFRKLPVRLVYLPTVAAFMVIGGLRLYVIRAGLGTPTWLGLQPFLAYLSVIVAVFDFLVMLWGYRLATLKTRRSVFWPVLFGAEAVLIIASFFLQAGPESTWVGYYDVFCLVLPLPLIIWPAYTQARFRFFDVLLKRGLAVVAFTGLTVLGLTVLTGVLTVVTALEGNHFPALLQSGFVGLIAPCLTALFLVPVSTIFMALRPGLDTWVDRVWLRRPDYGALFLALSRQVQQAANEATALDLVRGHFKEILQAEEVTFIKAEPAGFAETSLIPDSLAPVVRVPVASGPKQFGWFEIVGGAEGIRVLSEDLRYLERVAAQLAGTLFALSAQAEQAAQLKQEQALRELATQAQVRALRAQINPHFLFNCLNLLNSLVRIDPDRARTVMQSLAAMFRYTLDSTERETVSLGEEMDFVKNYVAITQARFGDRISIAVNVPEACRSVLILPMLIQPLIENALHHGLEPKMGKGEIQVTAGLADGWLWVTVADDGIGFDAKTLELMGTETEPKNSDRHAGVALRNLSERIKSCLGGQLRIQSQPHQGTRIEIRLPAKS
ncbi:MAG: sensor histidine kinase [Blastocatellia bacterium]|nr:sensor histidine kinase [Blastocatellia bacterium]